MRILFIGDVFGDAAIVALGKHLKKIVIKEKIDFVIVQGENVSGRKGMIPSDYKKLKDAGVDAFTMGNHVWAKSEIFSIIENKDIIRPYNIDKRYAGHGYSIFKVKGKTLRVSSFLGISFNELYGEWKQKTADNFFDAFDELQAGEKVDYEFIDFHAETTSEKNVFGLYVDGKVNALVGTHTHVQTNDAQIFPKGTAYLTDAGMTGPITSAIGASYETIYKRMRTGAKVRFGVSQNSIRLHGAIISMNKNGNKIETYKKDLR